jgi:hypothetical protein
MSMGVDDSAMMLGLVVIVNDGPMNVSRRRQMHRKLKSSIPPIPD